MLGRIWQFIKKPFADPMMGELNFIALVFFIIIVIATFFSEEIIQFLIKITK